MLIISTAIFFHVLAKNGVIWEGVGAGWLLALFLDFALYGVLIHAIFKSSIN